MATLTQEQIEAVETRYPRATRSFMRLRLAVGALALATIGFFVGLWYEFDVPSALDRYNYDRLEIATHDIYAYKIHATVDLRAVDEIEVALEGQRRTRFDELPDWVTGENGRYVIELGGLGFVRIEPGLVEIENADGAIGRIRTPIDGRGDPELLTPEADRANGGFLQVAERRITARLGLNARVAISTSKIEVLRHFNGWENFWFPFDHPMNGAGLGDVWSAIFADAPISTSQAADESNLGYLWRSFLTNPEWQHGEVFEALWLTILMAALGTMLASMIGLPLAFVAARNVNPVTPIQFAVKKFFDLLRAIDTLIWSLIFIRGFGPGPLAGTLAIATTDTGTLGKLYSEAIENADKRQVEGVSAAGAGAIQRNWFGIFPQILPVFVSQGLYFLESNTRSATIIGILGAGGIGLKLADSMRTGRDWENTMYIILLIILVVIVMDNLSSWLRRRLIEGVNPELGAIIERQRARRGMFEKGVQPAA